MAPPVTSRPVGFRAAKVGRSTCNPLSAGCNKSKPSKPPRKMMTTKRFSP
eukprot:CAMPEP_0184437668 /NCGR_PEP_ID=MMETSP0738-20130409/608062_1 /TAXON_ID=385413 /ORGANISM="Thalassiosira miniscula, Strain CCMP1093" /LENGTH=49 /DNA_ID= /DNA_START= /DNA_END= /DNA_ORIENTATION=